MRGGNAGKFQLSRIAIRGGGNGGREGGRKVRRVKNMGVAARAYCGENSLVSPWDRN